MIRRLGALVAVAAGVAFAAQPASAQAFKVGQTDIGPVIGLGGIHGANIAFGGRFERGFKQVPDLGNGIIGLMVGVDYYSWGDSFGGFGWNWTYIPIGATANYHFQLTDNDKLDPFVGLGLGYYVISCDYPGTGFDPCGGASTLYFIGRVGGRYNFSERGAFYAEAGTGTALINAGFLLRLR
jgi:hypothetical protein